MKENTDKRKNIVNGRLLKKYGSWMYCGRCNNTVGYLCYTTYEYFKFEFICNCGNNGIFELGQKDKQNDKQNEKIGERLVIKKKRLCCCNDGSPLFTIVEKNLKQFSYEVICKSCLNLYKKNSDVIDGELHLTEA